MKALDTNVLARFFIDDEDDPQAAAQRPMAIQAMAGRAFVSVTVLLEFEWVMRGFYALPKTEIERVLRALAGIEHITLEDCGAVLGAIDAFSTGMDFSDALHLLRSSRAAAFVTFDRRLARQGERVGIAGNASRVVAVALIPGRASTAICGADSNAAYMGTGITFVSDILTVRDFCLTFETCKSMNDERKNHHEHVDRYRPRTSDIQERCVAASGHQARRTG